jgi:DNA-binding response OmpR family regulator
MSKETILIVEDHDDIRKFIKRTLDSENFNVICSANGYEALKMIAENKNIDLILLDLMMPHVDGETFYTKVKQHGILDSKVCVVSAKSDQDTVTKMAKLGISDYIVKPVDGILLINKVNSMLNRHSPKLPFISCDMDLQINNFPIKNCFLQATNISEEAVIVTSNFDIGIDTTLDISSEKFLTYFKFKDFKVSVTDAIPINKDSYQLTLSFTALTEDQSKEIRSYTIQGVPLE